jgi:hypothetical protein
MTNPNAPASSAPMRPARVVNCRREPCDIYIGRPSKWGNPYSHIPGRALTRFRVATREQAIRHYAAWLRGQPDLVATVKRELRGKDLGCWCKPLSCHGDILAEIANKG